MGHRGNQRATEREEAAGADSEVRVKVGAQWSNGVAHLIPMDNARRRMFRLNPLNGLYIAIAGREHLTIRIGLDPMAQRPIS